MILLETVGQRWYAFGFLVAFFWAASAERGWKRALRFLLIAAIVSGVAEYLSTHYGIPYGRYSYTARTQGAEAYLSNIPLFVPLTFGIVVWAGRALAQAGWGARTPGRTIIGGAVAATAIDLVIDPMTLLGHTWFLGRLYAYDDGGWWFDVPWSNYAGWLVVSGLILFVDEAFESGRAREVEPIRGVTLAFGICAFFVLIALATRHWLIATAGAAVTFGLYATAAASVRELLTTVEPGPEGVTT